MSKEHAKNASAAAAAAAAAAEKKTSENTELENAVKKEAEKTRARETRRAYILAKMSSHKGVMSGMLSYVRTLAGGMRGKLKADVEKELHSGKYAALAAKYDDLAVKVMTLKQEVDTINGRIRLAAAEIAERAVLAVDEKSIKHEDFAVPLED